MTLVEIDLSLEPACLQALRTNTDMTFDDLRVDCKSEVVNLLRTEQKNLCAYCQKSIENVMTIEHYIAQNDLANIGQDLQLNFSNFLGVCTGKFYINKMAGTHDEHCDTSRGNIPLSIDPRMPEHIATISYTDDFKIISSTPDFHNDLDIVLNLNIDGICDLRNKSFENYFTQIRIDLSGLNPLELYRRALRDIEINPPEYYGYLKFMFEKLLENEMNNMENL
jgi:uncharacterized protein (TIGR02646 family)